MNRGFVLLDMVVTLVVTSIFILILTVSLNTQVKGYKALIVLREKNAKDKYQLDVLLNTSKENLGKYSDIQAKLYGSGLNKYYFADNAKIFVVK